jgi:tRNA(fMet)-specific endonuclease VapC
MSRRLLDTDILSEIIKSKNAVIAAKAATYLTEHGRFTTSAITVAEIVYGFRRMGREDRVNQFEASLELTEILPLDDGAARLAGRINADLESRGRTIGMPDVMIAAIALRNGLPIVTGNIEFVRTFVAGIDLDLGGVRRKPPSRQTSVESLSQ